MDTDREWEIMLLEIEAENKDLILNFYLERMRPRDLQALATQGEQQQEVLPAAPAEGDIYA